MNPSTLIRRTPAGDAELAAPASGLSISQRRFLTFLDTPATFDQVAAGHRLERDKAERDAARLAQAGLIAAERLPPAANDADSLPAPVRLGGPHLSRLAPIALLALVAGALAWYGWQHFTSSPAIKRSHAGTTRPSAASARPAEVPAEPPVIATRTLRSDTPERPTKDRPKASDSRHQGDTAKAAPAAGRTAARESGTASGDANSLAGDAQRRDAAPSSNAAAQTSTSERAESSPPNPAAPDAKPPEVPPTPAASDPAKATATPAAFRRE